MRNYLINMRQQRNLPAQDVANNMKISPSAYSLIESGKRQQDMTISVMNKLASVFKIPPEEIFRLEQDYRAQRDTA